MHARWVRIWRSAGRDTKEDVKPPDDAPTAASEHVARTLPRVPHAPPGGEPSGPGFIRIEAAIDGDVVLSELRAFVRNAIELLQIGPFDNLVLVAHELIKNALALDEVEVHISLQRKGLAGVRVEVRDYGYGRPHLDEGESSAELGLGLTIVDRFADDWGVDEFLPGKIVWFEMASPGPT